MLGLSDRVAGPLSLYLLHIRIKLICILLFGSKVEHFNIVLDVTGLSILLIAISECRWLLCVDHLLDVDISPDIVSMPWILIAP